MMVRRTAKDIAGAFYEENRSERFRKFWPDQKEYIARNWPDFVEEARGALAGLLADKGTAEHIKEEIYEALQEDNRRQMQHGGEQHDAGRMIMRADEPGQIEQNLFWKN
jgi:hypothetical protein